MESPVKTAAPHVIITCQCAYENFRTDFDLIILVADSTVSLEHYLTCDGFDWHCYFPLFGCYIHSLLQMDCIFLNLFVFQDYVRMLITLTIKCLASKRLIHVYQYHKGIRNFIDKFSIDC